MNFLDSVTRIDKNSIQPGLRSWQKTLKDALPLQGANGIMLDRNVPGAKLMKDELSLLGVQSFDVVTNPSDFLRFVPDRPYSFAFVDYNIDEKRNGQVLLEELRERNSINWQTILVLLSGDRSRSLTIACSEFEPDMVLIKPFSAMDLSRRIISLYARKKTLSRVEKLIVDNALDQATLLADELRSELPHYEKDLMKLKIKATLLSGNKEKAETLLKSQVGPGSHSWIDVTLSSLCLERGDVSDAESWLRKAVSANPNHLSAFEALTDILIETKREEEALTILEGLSSIATPSIKRLRKLADISELMGDIEKRKFYLNRVIDKATGTTLIRTDDYYRIAECHLEQRRPDDAFKTAAKLRSMVDANEGEIAESLMVIYGHQLAQDIDRAKNDLEGVIRKITSKGVNMSMGGQILLMKLCARLGLRRKAEQMRDEMAKQNLDKGTSARIRMIFEKPARASV